MWSALFLITSGASADDMWDPEIVRREVAVVACVAVPGRTLAFSATPPRPLTMEELGRRAPLLWLGAGAGPLGMGAELR